MSERAIRADPRSPKRDILGAGADRGPPAAVDVLVKDGPELVRKTLIEELKIPFTRSSPDALDFAQEAGHSRRRILHVEDATGRTIEQRFLRALKRHPRVTLLAGHTAVDLLTGPHHSKNPVAYYPEPRTIVDYVLDNKSGEVGRVFAPFPVRGEGARLKTRDGKTFTEKYSPKRDLAPRDEVARAIYEEMIVTNSNYVLLDLASYAKVADIRRRFPTIYKTCLEDGIDITRTPIPVVPAAHYCCGGVLADGWGRTSLAGLYAVGEVSCTGVHGANRLASTSLLEGLVWGTRAARDIAARLERSRPHDASAL